MTTCHEEVLEAAEQLTARGDGTFSPDDVVRALADGPYAPSTIRTHVVSRMCSNAPKHHGVVYDDFVRVSPGRYRIKG